MPNRDEMLSLDSRGGFFWDTNSVAARDFGANAFPVSKKERDDGVYPGILSGKAGLSSSLTLASCFMKQPSHNDIIMMTRMAKSPGDSASQNMLSQVVVL